MNTSNEAIECLQQDLLTIRKIVGWSAEYLGKLLGVKQPTISHLETKRTKLNKVHYLAIRMLIQEEIKSGNNALKEAMSIFVDGNNISDKVKDYIRNQIAILCSKNRK